MFSLKPFFSSNAASSRPWCAKPFIKNHKVQEVIDSLVAWLLLKWGNDRNSIQLLEDDSLGFRDTAKVSQGQDPSPRGRALAACRSEQYRLES